MVCIIISISGTPGTGKTVVSKIIAKKLGTNLITVKNVIKKEKVPFKHDKERKTKIIDIKDLNRAIAKNIDKNKNNIIEGHLSHLIKSDIVIILRCNPEVLKKRLTKRKWNKRKINENILAEVLDSTTIEALEIHSKKRIFEIDTSKKKVKDIVGIAMSIIKKKNDYKDYRAGKIDWTEKYLRKTI